MQEREYPEYDYCQGEKCRGMFRERSGMDRQSDLDDPSASVEWQQFRYG